MNSIHHNAKIGKNVTVGPFSSISEHVEIGEGTKIESNVVIMDYVKIGSNCHIFPGAVIGAIPQDLKFKGEISWVEIGNNCSLREYVTVNRGTEASRKLKTEIGNDCLIMSYSHVAHDCFIGNNVVLASFTGLAGETDIYDYAILGGKTGTHQFTRIGAHAMTMGGSLVGKDIPPYIIAGHLPLSYGGVNRIGLRRRGFAAPKIEEISSIYKVIYQSNLNTTDACNKVEQDFPQTEERDLILNFIRSSKRGIIRRDASSDELEDF
ncbi:MAG: acyl-ACP--UDP-N-acetylglucosamine O-acyltransferase [Prevotellaceae bacterium]|jgi:UDP-N-acetylglucosamine acyltransferase|nr:acyl-ACP--UDP-N-acetylglucosamine O-acyltransferase [Prevotellaceae bacterium]